MTIETGLQNWIAGRTAQWRKLQATISALQRNQRSSVEEATNAIDTYRELARDLSFARRVVPTSRITRGLEEQYGIMHALIHRPYQRWRDRIATLFLDDVPAITRELKGYIQAIAALFIFATAAGWWLINTYPELISLIASEQMITTVEHGRLWTESIVHIAPPSLISLGILSNNIVVSLFAFCTGILFGLGAFYLISTNGLMLGALFAFTHQHGLAGDLFKFVIAHGVVELSVICLAGAAGTAVGDALIRPTAPTRRESFRLAVARVSPLLGACALLLIGCGFIEGYVSPDADFPLLNRIVIGLGYGVVMIGLLSGNIYPRRWLRRPRVASNAMALSQPFVR